MGVRIQGTNIVLTESMLGSRKLPKYIVSTARFDMHFNKRATAAQRAKLHRTFGFWRVKPKAI